MSMWFRVCSPGSLYPTPEHVPTPHSRFLLRTSCAKDAYEIPASLVPAAIIVLDVSVLPQYRAPWCFGRDKLPPSRCKPVPLGCLFPAPAVFQFTAPSNPDRHREALAVFNGVSTSDPSITAIPDSAISAHTSTRPLRASSTATRSRAQQNSLHEVHQ
ncbi:hypothetical protein L227DRAFT_630105 [Lentinus tigrinus ALCF2SS1-6]|uniref:Uncharacterized protein n=1 Tax=Lentinus tigrinus ALCF2SS1-6 TaxID=1328759 RepID=A0A5C2RLQ3_9APHY|nr:hypothetical protein L227DRAFT_630105 [Lentinus tigrinus ALCF2SS1-6]